MLWEELYTVSVFAALTAMLSYFLDFCFNEGNIFAWYYRWLLDQFPDHWLGKPLGLCPYCMNVWLAFGSFGVLQFIEPVSWAWILPHVLISHTILSVLLKKL